MTTIKKSAEDELLDATAKSILADLLSPSSTTTARSLTSDNSEASTEWHEKHEGEKDADDGEGNQGGQNWRPPTSSPTAPPTSAAPTRSPTQHPTLRGEGFLLRGVVWYDRNGNGVRDSNVAVVGLGSDVEYSHGVGGVQVKLVQCDPKTGK